MAWTAPSTAVANTQLTAAVFNSNVRDNLLCTEVAKATQVSRYYITTGANAIAERRSATSHNGRSETTASVTFTDLSTGGPSVNITTGTEAIVFIQAQMQNDGASNLTAASYAISGATTVASSDDWMISMEGVTAANAVRYGAAHRHTGLTAGLNTFTMQYRVAAGTGTFANREIMVIAL